MPVPKERAFFQEITHARRHMVLHNLINLRQWNCSVIKNCKMTDHNMVKINSSLSQQIEFSLR